MGNLMDDAMYTISAIRREPLRRSGSKRACACRGRSAAHAHGRVLRFYRNELRVQVALRDHFRKMFHHVSLRCNRVRCNHIHIAKSHSFGRCDGDFNSHFTFHYGVSSTISMACTGHSYAQIPQPLQ